jgi:hypothetical protein
MLSAVTVSLYGQLRLLDVVCPEFHVTIVLLHPSVSLANVSMSQWVPLQTAQILKQPTTNVILPRLVGYSYSYKRSFLPAWEFGNTRVNTTINTAHGVAPRHDDILMMGVVRLPTSWG